MRLAGLELSRAEQLIQSESIRRGVYLHPQVTLQNVARRMHHITVAGAVTEPGVKELPASACDLFGALSAAGALEPDASTTVEVTFPPAAPVGQGAATTRTVPDRLEASHTKRGEIFIFPMEAGVMVLRRDPPTVQVMGLVNKPVNVPLPLDRELRLLEAIAEAGGRKLSIADKVLVTRRSPAGSRGDRSVLPPGSPRAWRESSAGPRRRGECPRDPLTSTVATFRDLIRFGFTSPVPGL